MTLAEQLADASTAEAVAALVVAHLGDFTRALRLLEIEPDLREACAHGPKDADLSGRLCDIGWMLERATVAR